MNPAQRQTAEGLFFNDAYQLSIVHLTFHLGLQQIQAQFDRFSRSTPSYDKHKSGYCVNPGLEWLLDWMLAARFREQDIAFQRKQTWQTGERLFDGDFLAPLEGQGDISGVKQLMNPHIYHVSLRERSWQLKQDMVAFAH